MSSKQPDTTLLSRLIAWPGRWRRRAEVLTALAIHGIKMSFDWTEGVTIRVDLLGEGTQEVNAPTWYEAIDKLGDVMCETLHLWSIQIGTR